MDYNIGVCPNAEKLHFEQMIISEHIRPPCNKHDIDDIIKSIVKVIG